MSYNMQMRLWRLQPPLQYQTRVYGTTAKTCSGDIAEHKVNDTQGSTVHKDDQNIE